MRTDLQPAPAPAQQGPPSADSSDSDDQAQQRQQHRRHLHRRQQQRAAHAGGSLGHRDAAATSFTAHIKQAPQESPAPPPMDAPASPEPAEPIPNGPPAPAEADMKQQHPRPDSSSAVHAPARKSRRTGAGGGDGADPESDAALLSAAQEALMAIEQRTMSLQSRLNSMLANAGVFLHESAPGAGASGPDPAAVPALAEPSPERASEPSFDAAPHPTLLMLAEPIPPVPAPLLVASPSALRPGVIKCVPRAPASASSAPDSAPFTLASAPSPRPPAAHSRDALSASASSIAKGAAADTPTRAPPHPASPSAFSLPGSPKLRHSLSRTLGQWIQEGMDWQLPT